MKLSTLQGVALATAGITALGLTGAVANAAPPSDATTQAVATIAKYNPDMTVDEITQELTAEAENEGTSLDVLAPQIAADVEKEAAEVQKDREVDEAMSESSSQVSTRSSSEVSRDKILPHGKVLGDIYWTAAGAGWNHVGLYYHVDMAAEAPGKGQVSRVVYTNQVKVANNYGRYSIRVDKPYRVSAANWASRHRGKPALQDPGCSCGLTVCGSVVTSL